MPQMSPLMWFSLYMYVMVLMMMFMVIIYYFYFISIKLIMYNFLIKLNFYKFKW